MKHSAFPLLLATFVLSSYLIASPAFAVQDCSIITDPEGDVTLQGGEATSTQPDLNASDILLVERTSSTDMWVFDVTTKATFAAPKGQLANLDFLFDVDGDAKNNYNRESNERSGADVFLTVISTNSSTAPWKIRYQTYAPSKGWSSTTTLLSWNIADDRATLSIPKTSLPLTSSSRWRVVSNIGMIGKWYTRDSAPEKSTKSDDCGYSPFVVTATSTSYVTPGRLPWLSYFLVGLGLAVMGIAVAKGKA